MGVWRAPVTWPQHAAYEGRSPAKWGRSEWREAGESARAPAVPTGSTADRTSRSDGRHQQAGRKRSPSQSNPRVEHEALYTSNVTGIAPHADGTIARA